MKFDIFCCFGLLCCTSYIVSFIFLSLRKMLLSLYFVAVLYTFVQHVRPACVIFPYAKKTKNLDCALFTPLMIEISASLLFLCS